MAHSYISLVVANASKTTSNVTKKFRNKTQIVPATIWPRQCKLIEKPMITTSIYKIFVSVHPSVESGHIALLCSAFILTGVTTPLKLRMLQL